MPQSITLADLMPGQRAQVGSVALTGGMRRRLQDVGLVPGATVVCVARGMLGGPIALRVRGAVVALRLADAGRVAALV